MSQYNRAKGHWTISAPMIDGVTCRVYAADNL
jgi:hypothetical protein